MEVVTEMQWKNQSHTEQTVSIFSRSIKYVNTHCFIHAAFTLMIQGHKIIKPIQINLDYCSLVHDAV